MLEIDLELVRGAYNEHRKAAHDMSFYLPLGHPKRLETEAELERLRLRMFDLEKEKSHNERS